MNYLITLVATVLTGGEPEPNVWSSEAHKVVCEIAWRRLDDGGRELAAALLSNDSAASFAESCLWADRVKRSTHAYSRAYHYVNIPTGAAGFEMSRDCGDTEALCVTWAIPHYALALQDRSSSSEVRLEALKFLGHFVGDIHQPLHAGRPEDRGGNSIRLRFFGADSLNGYAVNLHSVWDYSILERAGLRWPDTAVSLNEEISNAEAREWEDMDVLGWTNASYRIVEDMIYDFGEEGVTEDYYQQALQLSRLRIKQAGVRLAYLINRAAAGELEFSGL